MLLITSSIRAYLHNEQLCRSQHNVWWKHGNKNVRWCLHMWVYLHNEQLYHSQSTHNFTYQNRTPVIISFTMMTYILYLILIHTIYSQYCSYFFSFLFFFWRLWQYCTFCTVGSSRFHSYIQTQSVLILFVRNQTTLSL